MSEGVEPVGNTKMLRGVVIGFIALVVLIAVGAVGGNFLTATLFESVIRAELNQPADIDGSKVVVVSDATSFVFSNSQFAQLRVPRSGLKRLLSSGTVFNDCHSQGRQCSVPAWSKGSPYFDEGSSHHIPDDALCSQSFAAGSEAGANVHEVCVDLQLNALYYTTWSEGH